MPNETWLMCPVCRGKTRLKLREDTELRNFPLFCPKCRRETLIHVRQLHITVVQEPAAQTLEQMDREKYGADVCDLA